MLYKEQTIVDGNQSVELNVSESDSTARRTGRTIARATARPTEQEGSATGSGLSLGTYGNLKTWNGLSRAKEKAFEMKCMLCCPLKMRACVERRGKREWVGVSTKPTRLTAGIEAKGSRAGMERERVMGEFAPRHSSRPPGESAGNSSRSGALKNHCDSGGKANKAAMNAEMPSA